jgi:uncharacterized protein with HEPN domain
MTNDATRLIDYLGHILQAIERIENYTQDITEIAFQQTPLVQDAVIRNIEIIGEASHNIEKHCPAFAAERRDLPLSFAYQMRNALAHGYSKVNLDVVWKTIQTDLADLYMRVQECIQTLGP